MGVSNMEKRLCSKENIHGQRIFRWGRIRAQPDADFGIPDCGFPDLPRAGQLACVLAEGLRIVIGPMPTGLWVLVDFHLYADARRGRQLSVVCPDGQYLEPQATAPLTPWSAPESNPTVRRARSFSTIAIAVSSIVDNADYYSRRCAHRLP